MIDWALLAMLVRAHYKPLSQVAKEVGSDWRHLNRLARGEVAEPKFGVGMRLLDLAYDKVPPEKFRKVIAEKYREVAA